MKKLLFVLLASILAIGFSYGGTYTAEAKTKIINYRNCKELNKVYKGGVARTAKVKNKGGKTHYKPHVSKALYDVNKGKDRDHDYIACER